MNSAPLADRMRPTSLDDFIGQAHIVGRGCLLRRAIETDTLQSTIFWGPPGCGKTTLASIIAHTTNSEFVKLNAVTSGVKEVREVIAEAERRRSVYGRETFLLLDECHRWSKTQSDSILPALESGTIKFIGSTTENPMISMTSAIVSRCRLFQFYPLHEDELMIAMNRALEDSEKRTAPQHTFRRASSLPSRSRAPYDSARSQSSNRARLHRNASTVHSRSKSLPHGVFCSVSYYQ